MNRLDFERPYGRIHGACTVAPGAVYTQDGKFFTSTGRPISEKESNYGRQNEQGSNVQVNANGEEGQGQGQIHGHGNGHGKENEVQEDEKIEPNEVSSNDESNSDSQDNESGVPESEPTQWSEGLASQGTQEDAEPEIASSVSVSEPIPESEPVPTVEMLLTDEELDDLAERGMNDLRAYAALFGVKGRAKNEIIEELKALRT